MSKVKISVIIPVFNCEDYLQVCLRSVVSQTFSEIEIIVVNAASTDASGCPQVVQVSMQHEHHEIRADCTVE